MVCRISSDIFREGCEAIAEPVYRALGVTPIHPNPDHNATMRYVAPICGTHMNVAPITWDTRGLAHRFGSQIIELGVPYTG